MQQAIISELVTAYNQVTGILGGMCVFLVIQNFITRIQLNTVKQKLEDIIKGLGIEEEV